MSNPKRHHYVPITYLDNWVSAKTKMLMTKLPSGKNRPSKPDNVFVENYLYRIKNSADEFIIEKAYSNIEGRYKDLIRPIRRGEIIAPEQMNELSYFMAHQILRTKAYRTFMDKTFEEMLEVELKRREKKGLDFALPIHLLENPDDLTTLDNNWKTIQLFIGAEELSNELLRKQWSFYEFPRSRLLTSGNPISFISYNPNASSLSLRATECDIITYPISRTRALILQNESSKFFHSHKTSVTLTQSEDEELADFINKNTWAETKNGIAWHHDDSKYLQKFIA